MISECPADRNSIVLSPGGALDNTNAHEMAESIAEAQDEGYEYIIIDMTELKFLSSAGVGSILGSVEQSREMGGDIVLCGPSDKIVHILNVLDLCDYLTIKSEEEVGEEFSTVED